MFTTGSWKLLFAFLFFFKKVWLTFFNFIYLFFLNLLMFLNLSDLFLGILPYFRCLYCHTNEERSNYIFGQNLVLAWILLFYLAKIIMT